MTTPVHATSINRLGESHHAHNCSRCGRYLGDAARKITVNCDDCKSVLTVGKSQTSMKRLRKIAAQEGWNPEDPAGGYWPEIGGAR